MSTQKVRGYSLIEAIAAIAIFTLMATSAASLYKILPTSRLHSQVLTLRHLLQLTRSSAISTGRVITLCGTMDKVNCSRDWFSPNIIIFDDRNENHAIDSDEKIIRQESIEKSQTYWRGSNRSYLRFRANGSPMEWGHFTLCPPEKTMPATQIILNIVGRIYVKELPLTSLPIEETCN